jgi:hemerythrin
MNSGQFKFKPDKIKYLTNVSTLDSSHTKIIDDINKKRNFLPKKEKKLEKLKCMLKELDENSGCVENYVYLKS